LGPRDAESLKKFPQLTSLSVSKFLKGSPDQDREVVNAMSALTKLKHLDVTSIALGQLKAAGLTHMPGITSVTWPVCWVEDLHNGVPLPLLEELKGSIFMDTLCDILRQLPHLKRLNANILPGGDVKLSTTTVDLLNSLESVHLDVSKTEWSWNARLFEITSLTSLCLRYRYPKQLVALVNLPMLKDLSIGLSWSTDLFQDFFSRSNPLNLSSFRLKALDGRWAFPGFGYKIDRLQSMHLENFLIEHEWNMYGLTALTELSLENTHLESGIGFDFLYSLRRLKRLVLDDPSFLTRFSVTNHPLDHRSLPELTSLKIVVPKNKSAWIRSLAKLSRLEILAIDFDKEYTLQVEDFSQLAKLTNLRVLEIRACTDRNWNPQLKILAQLESLKIDVVGQSVDTQMSIDSMKARRPYLKTDIQISH